MDTAPQSLGLSDCIGRRQTTWTSFAILSLNVEGRIPLNVLRLISGIFFHGAVIFLGVFFPSKVRNLKKHLFYFEGRTPEP